QRVAGERVIAVAAVQVRDGAAGGEGDGQVGVDGLLGRLRQVEGDAGGGAGEADRVDAGGVGDGVTAQGGVGDVGVDVVAGTAIERVVAGAADQCVFQRVAGKGIVAVAAVEVLDGAAGSESDFQVR